MKHRILSIALAALFLAGPPEGISAPPLINYQGRIAVGIPAVNFDGTGQFKFALVNGAGNIVFWSNSPDVAPADGVPDTAVPLTVVKGLYSVLLGDTSLGAPMAAIPASALTTNDVRLRVWFSDNTPTGFQLLSPDQRLAPTAYLADGVVSSVHLADAAITSAKVADGAVVSAKIAPATITGDRLAPSTLTAGNLLTPGGIAAGKVLSFDGTNLLWATPSGGGGIWALNGTSDAYYNGGNVGIGTAAPVAADGLARTFQIGDRSIIQSTVGTQTTISNNAYYNGAWRYVTSSYASAVRLNGLGNTGDITFSTAPSGTAGAILPNWDTSNIRMAISNNGNVGIGTPTPTQKLDIVGSSPIITMADSGAGGIRTEVKNDGGDLYLISAGFLNGSNTNGFVRLSGGGNVGIGTYSANSKLEIAGSQDILRLVGYQPFLTLYDSNTGFAASRIQAVGGALIFETQSYIASGPNNHYARLDSNGNFSVRMLTIRGGADLAEPFQMKEEELEKGSVVVIDDEHPGRLKRSASAYDTRVAGIISGANGIAPGIALHQEGVIEGGQNVALSGRVYVQADASSGSIKPGDLLTTSDTPGHAMKVTEPTRAQGAVIGKAMSSLAEGTGMVLVLVTLQ